MPTCVLVVDWHYVTDSASRLDLLCHPALLYRSFLFNSIPPSCLQSTHAVGDWSSAPSAAAEAAFRRLGCRLHACSREARARSIAWLVRSQCLASTPRHFVLLADPETVGSLAEEVTRAGSSVEVWSFNPPGRPGEHDARELLRFHPAVTYDLYVDWPRLEAGLRRQGVRVDAAAVARDLLRCARATGEVLHAVLFDSAGPASAGGEVREAFHRAGYQIVPAREGVTVEALRGARCLAAPGFGASSAVFVGGECFPPALAELSADGQRLVLWAADETSLAGVGRLGVEHAVFLPRLLSLRPQSVAMFIDYENIARSLFKAGYGVDPATIARGLTERARAFGHMPLARAYADWDQFMEVREPDGRLVRRGAQRTFCEAEVETVYVVPGPNSADVQLARDVENALGSAEAPDIFIIVSGDGDFSKTIESIRRRRAQAWVWSVRSATSADLCERADRHEWLEDLLSLEPPRARALGLAEPGSEGLDEDPAPAVTGEGQLSAWTRLVYAIEKMLRQHGWQKMAFRRLATALAEYEEFGPTPANSMMWLNRAKSDGLLITEQETHRNEPQIRVTVCRLNYESPAAAATLDALDRIIRLLYQMLQRMPWVSFKLLRTVLQRDQWLGGPPHRLDEACVEAWVNFLVEDGVIIVTREPNAEHPEFPVTALRLNGEHPLVRGKISQVVEEIKLPTERVVLAVDHFQLRARKPWMAMSALRRALEPLGREELNDLLQSLQESGVLQTASYSNPQREHATTGCTLPADHPTVQEVVQIRNGLVRALQYLLRHRPWVPVARVDEEFTSEAWSRLSEAQRLAWVLLLQEEGVLELDRDGAGGRPSWHSLHARLNLEDAVVKHVVASTPPEIQRLPPNGDRWRRSPVASVPADGNGEIGDEVAAAPLPFEAPAPGEPAEL